MRTKEEIFERYQSGEVEDMFDAQKTALLCMLPYEMAKPHLDPIYVEKMENNTLPEEERWKDGWDIKDQIKDYLPNLYSDIKRNDIFNMTTGFCYLRSWIWVDDPEFFDIVDLMFESAGPQDAKALTDFIAKFYGYEEPVIEEPITDVPFEELSDENS